MADRLRRAGRRLSRLAPAAATGALLAGAAAAQALPDVALRQSARIGDVGRIAQLLDRGVDVDAADAEGRTALLLAVASGQTEAARVLLKRGASPNARANNMDTPWLLAGAEGLAPIISAMLPYGPDLKLRNRFGGTALIPACERAHVDAVAVLLTTRIDVNHVNDLGWTCLLEIVLLGNGGERHQEVARLVLAAGANPNLADRQGMTPLAHAKLRGQTAIANLIEQAGGK